MIAPRHRIGYVDGLRAVAVLSVVAFHAAIGIPRISAMPVAWGLTLTAKHGVDLFFVLSGFCLSYPTLKRLRETSVATFSMATFAAKRMVRILPPYFAAIAVLSVAAGALWHFRIVYSAYEPFSWLVVAQNFLFADASTLYVNPSFWTLAVEARWYAMFPFLLWLWVRSPRAFATLGCLCLLAYFTRANSLDVSILPAFMLGIVSADMRIRGFRLPMLALPVGLAIGVVAIAQGDINVSVAYQVTAFLIVAGVGQSEMCKRLLSLKAITVFGIASYSIYLVHEPIIRILERYQVFSFYAAVIAITLGFAFWSLIESPFTSNPLRSRLVSWAQSKLTRAIAFAGFPQNIVLRESAVKTSEIVRAADVPKHQESRRGRVFS